MQANRTGAWVAAAATSFPDSAPRAGSESSHGSASATPAPRRKSRRRNPSPRPGKLLLVMLLTSTTMIAKLRTGYDLNDEIRKMVLACRNARHHVVNQRLIDDM